MTATNKMLSLAGAFVALAVCAANAALRIPAFTAYLEPEERGARISSRLGVTGWTNPRLDRFMGVEDGVFFLSHGGFLDGFTKAGDSFSRPSTGGPPRFTLTKP